MSASLSANRYRYWADYLYDWSPTVNHDRSKTGTAGGELRLISTTWRNHKLVAGVEYQKDTRRLQNYDSAPFASYLDIDVPRHRYGIYVQDDIRLGERLGVNIGVRHDHDSEGGNADSPRLALP